MFGNNAGGWIALVFLFLVKVQCGTSTTLITKNELFRYRLPTEVIPTSYDIKVTPLMGDENFTFNGETKILIRVLNETVNITLHAYHDLKVNEHATSLTDTDGKLMKPNYHHRDNRTDFLTLNFDEILKPGNYFLNFQFAGNISSEPAGIYKSSYVNAQRQKIWLVSTRFSPTKARRAFPCWDEPALKATFNISVKHFANYTAASNMPVKNSIDAGNEQKWTIFNTTPVMSTCSVAFVVSDFQCISNRNKSINTCIQREVLSTAKFLQKINEKALLLLVEYTGMPYPLPKLDSYAIPEADTDGMENWGLIAYRASTLITDNTSFSRKESATEIFIHEIAHQWFGNLVTPAWWNDLWLQEGLSYYMQFYIADKIFPECETMNALVTRTLQTISYSLESSRNTKNLNWAPKSSGETYSHFSFMARHKGASIIHMLRHIIGEQNLLSGIRIYLKKHQYGTATSDDFWHAMQEACASNKDIRIKDVMDPYIKQKGYPIVKVMRDYVGDIAVLTHSSNWLNDTASRWYIPITFATESKPSYKNTLPTHWLKPYEANATIAKLNKEEWIIVNLEQSGYYRVDYDENNWLKLAKYLDTDNFTNIHVLNRAQIINDLFYMVVFERHNLTTFLEMTKYLAREVDYIPWQQALKSFTALRGKIQDETFFNNLKKYALHLMRKIIEKVGFSEHSNDAYMTKRWRSDILIAACYYGHVECREIAGNKLIGFLQNPNGNPMPTNLENWIWHSAIYNKKAEMLLQKKIESGAYQYMEYMTLSQNYSFFRKFIEMAMINLAIPKNFTRLAFRRMGECGDKYWDDALDYYINNFERINKYFNETDTAASILREYILGIPSLEHIKKITEFVKKKDVQMATWAKSSILQQTEKLEWSKINAPIFNNWLEEELAKLTLPA